ncbi:MAG: PqqD family peptide modification chaperone [Anaerolineae bacterium]|nr:PqqD family peptide modification chaperone [Anaerolineae bacterium]
MTSRYIRNPDVVLREEEAAGGLLFNPDTNDIKIINSTGLFIWNLCDGTQDVPALIAAVQAAFDDVPEGHISGHVEAFLNRMQADQFVGLVES